MFYLLLALPHVIALAGLFAFAYYTSQGGGSSEESDGGSDRNDGGLEPPREPQPKPSGGGLPLSESDPPRRRLRDGERLADLHPRPVRRDRERETPRRAPAGS